MKHNIISMACTILLNLLALSTALAAPPVKDSYIDLSKFLNDEADKYNDIGYVQMVPQFEEVPNPAKASTVEIFIGEYDTSKSSDERLRHIKSILNQDLEQDPNFKLEIISISKDGKTPQRSKTMDHVLGAMNLKGHKVHYQEIPDFINFSTEKEKREKKSHRVPSSLKLKPNGRQVWTVIRFASIGGANFAALYFMKDLSATAAISASLPPGLISAAMTYYSNYFDAFVTNGRWAKWLMTSDKYFAKKMRTSFGLNALSLEKSLIRNKEYFKILHPNLYRKNPSLFVKKINDRTAFDTQESTIKISKLLTHLKTAEEYFKWWVTEIAFTAVAIKLPQTIAGTSEFSSVLSMTGDVIYGSTLGTIAQAPGDIAIKIRKYQKIEDLKQSVLKGEVHFSDKKMLLSEIEKVLDQSEEFINYTIQDHSHKALVRIENWARSRATILSLFAVTGVVLEIAKVPHATSLLIAVGVGGMAYYGSVKGWVKLPNLTGPLKRYIQNFKDGSVKLKLQFLGSRYCSAKFMLKKKK